jgi:hypothetical protein
MPLPADFSHWEHLQDQLRRIHNKEVRDWFREIPDDDISTPKGSLKRACTMDDRDTAPMTIIRMLVFYINCGKARDFHPPMYTLPIQDNYERVAGRPQIKLFFLEDESDVDPGYERVAGEIGIRLMNETTETLTMANAKSLALKCKTAFGGGAGFIWKKGKYSFSYTDPQKGYRMKIFARSESEAKRVIEQVLDIQSHAPDWDNLNKNEAVNTATKYPTNPGTKIIMGKTYKKPRRRPVADVRFQHAELHVDGMPKPIILFDNSGRYYRETLEK